MKLKPSTSNFFKKAYWWLKASLLVVFIASLAYGVGTFMPNPIAVKQATEEVRIEHADWASKLGNSDYMPIKPPFTPEHLMSVELSPIFIDYMRRWKGFVTDGK